jgi:hypothetical protein
MRKFKLSIIALMTFFVALCIYWAVGRNVMIDSIEARTKTLQSEGYSVAHKGLSVGGFPVKFRASFANPDMTSPRALEKPWSIKADALRVEALTLNPLSWRGTHRGDARLDLRGPKGERWLFDARPFNIDFTAKLGFDGQLKAFDAIGSKLNTQAVIGTLPPIVAIEEANISAQPKNGSMRYALSLKDVFLEKDALKGFQNVFGPRIESLSGTILAEGLTGLDALSVEKWAETGRLKGDDWVIKWGDTVFNGRVDLTSLDTGLSGVIRLDVDNINILLDRFESANVFTARQTRNAKLASMLLPVNERGRQEITLTLRDGYLTLFGQKIVEL